jgi:hypothetical protein
MEWLFIPAQQTQRPEQDRMTNSLYESSGGMKERGGYQGHVAESSVYTQASRHPVLAGAALAGAAFALAAWWRDSHNGGWRNESGRYVSRNTPPLNSRP